MAVKELGCALVLALLCVSIRAEDKQYSVPDPHIEVFEKGGIRATIPDAKDIVYFLIQGQLIRNGTNKKEDFQGGETGSAIEVNDKKVWVVDLPNLKLNIGDKLDYLAFVAVNNDGYIKDGISYLINAYDEFTALPERPIVPQYSEVQATTKSCEASTTVLQKGGTVCKGQVVFEENFDALNKNVWQVENYIPTDHPEVPFVSYQSSAVSVHNGELHITASQQFNDSASLYSTLDLGAECTSGEAAQCSVTQSGEDSGREVPPVISGRITSKLGFSFKYGIVSVRAKFPKGDWIYPEVLLEPFLKKFGINSRNTGILKIASARGNANLNKKLYGGPVLDTRCHDALLVTKTESETAWSDDFHIYSVKWTPESLVLSVDGSVYATVEPAANGLRAKLPATCSGIQAGGIAPFNDFFYLTLGVAVGGDGEFHDANDTNNPKPWRNGQVNAATKFWKNLGWKSTWSQPELVVDYVKVEAL